MICVSENFCAKFFSHFFCVFILIAFVLVLFLGISVSHFAHKEIFYINNLLIPCKVQVKEGIHVHRFTMLVY